MVRLGLLKDTERKLDYVLGLTIGQFMERRLQTLVMKRKIANSIHHARVLIRQRHIAVGKQLVNIPSFMVRVSSEQHIQQAATSVFKTGALGRQKRKRAGAEKWSTTSPQNFKREDWTDFDAIVKLPRMESAKIDCCLST